MLKTSLLTLTIIGCYAIASEMEYRDHQNLENHRRQMYEVCISTSSQYVITDAEIDEMIALCSARTGYTSTD